jgi:hypothetical protein
LNHLKWSEVGIDELPNGAVFDSEVDLKVFTYLYRITGTTSRKFYATRHAEEGDKKAQ